MVPTALLFFAFFTRPIMKRRYTRLFIAAYRKRIKNVVLDWLCKRMGKAKIEHAVIFFLLAKISRYVIDRRGRLGSNPIKQGRTSSLIFFLGKDERRKQMEDEKRYLYWYDHRQDKFGRIDNVWITDDPDFNGKIDPRRYNGYPYYLCAEWASNGWVRCLDNTEFVEEWYLPEKYSKHKVYCCVLKTQDPDKAIDMIVKFIEDRAKPKLDYVLNMGRRITKLEKHKEEADV